MTKITIDFDPENYQALRELAEKDDRSLLSFCRRTLLAALNPKEEIKIIESPIMIEPVIEIPEKNNKKEEVLKKYPRLNSGERPDYIDRDSNTKWINSATSRETNEFVLGVNMMLETFFNLGEKHGYRQVPIDEVAKYLSGTSEHSASEKTITDPESIDGIEFARLSLHEIQDGGRKD